ncbi:hypothetical protein [Alkalibacillus silvisoli]|uniref:DUF4179 domain-containing protein n=1 Tax=Alkalibacillus silvisoli TaxID=392823 RepID=A0ABN1A6A2_9BACI
MKKYLIYSGVVVVFCLITIGAFSFLNGQVNHSDDEGSLNFVLSGESEYWELSHYKIEIKPQELLAGQGELKFKHGHEYDETDYFYYTVIANVNGNTETLASSSIHMKDGEKIGIDEFVMGENHVGGFFYNEEGEYVTEEDIWQIYIIMEWHDSNGEMVYDQMLLYQSNV